MGLSGDDRGLSTQVGVILLIAILVISLSIFQANVVPYENKQTEFRHYQDVQGDMQNLRNAIVEVGETNRLRSVTISMGTNYDPRTFLVNPSPPGGSLQASDRGEITVNGLNETALCGLDEVTTDSLTYSPNYNQLRNAPDIRYENTVLYRQTDDGNLLIDSDQALIRGETINLLALQSNISTTRSDAATFDFKGERTGVQKVTEPLTLTIPTELSVDAWENRTELLANEKRVQDVSLNQSTPYRAIDISLKTATYTVRCTAISEGQQPDVNIQVQSSAGEINPAGTGDIILEEEIRGQNQNSHKVTLRLNNTAAADIDITEARINFYQDVNVQGGAPTQADISAAGGPVSATLPFRGNFKKLDPRITLTGNSTTTDVVLAFKQSDGSDASIDSKDWFVISLVYTNDETGTYFVPIPG